MFLELLRNVVYVALRALIFCLFLRAILSWLPDSDDWAISDFLFAITEPFLIPVRNLLDRSSFFSGLPIDLSLFVVTLILVVLSVFI